MFDLIHYFYSWILSIFGIQDNIGLLGSMWHIFFLFMIILVIIGIALSFYLDYKENKKTK